MKIDKTHPKYNEYIDKCRKMADEELEELNKIPLKIQHDDPETSAVYRKYSARLKELQKEYSFLFSEE